MFPTQHGAFPLQLVEILYYQLYQYFVSVQLLDVTTSKWCEHTTGSSYQNRAWLGSPTVVSGQQREEPRPLSAGLGKPYKYFLQYDWLLLVGTICHTVLIGVVIFQKLKIYFHQKRMRKNLFFSLYTFYELVTVYFVTISVFAMPTNNRRYHSFLFTLVAGVILDLLLLWHRAVSGWCGLKMLYRHWLADTSFAAIAYSDHPSGKE